MPDAANPSPAPPPIGDVTDTATSDELLDVVEATGAPVGVAGRTEVHRRGLWHEVFHCLVVRPDPPARVVLQRRRRAARAFPGQLDLTVTGHLAAGEQPLDGRREISEELGIDVPPERLIPLGVRLLADDAGEGRNRERAHVYLLPDDRPLTAYPLDPAEVEGLVELTVADLLRLLAGAVSTAAAGGSSDRGGDRDDGSTVVVPCREIAAAPGSTPIDTTCRPDDLVLPLDGYWTVVAVMAERLVAGHGPLAV